MLGSFDEAEDAIQETFLRAWRARESLTDDSGRRAWLYKIATNVCLDALRKNKRQPAMVPDLPWLQPYPDRLLDEVAPSEQEPDAVVVARETIELTYITLIQLLPARQRAVLILRDVLDWSANETAELLDMSVASANSALQRARATLREELPEAEPRPAELTEDEQRLLAGFIATHEAGDGEAAAAMMREDIRITMPPHPLLFEGRESIAPLLERAFGPESVGEWRLVPARANRMPAAGSLPAPARGRPSSARSSSTSCASSTAGSPRSRPSTRRSSSSSGSPRHLRDEFAALAGSALTCSRTRRPSAALRSTTSTPRSGSTATRSGSRPRARWACSRSSWAAARGRR